MPELSLNFKLPSSFLSELSAPISEELLIIVCAGSIIGNLKLEHKLPEE